MSLLGASSLSRIETSSSNGFSVGEDDEGEEDDEE
jgi:hypothetical protein